jgi:hypothetical protein
MVVGHGPRTALFDDEGRQPDVCGNPHRLVECTVGEERLIAAPFVRREAV